MANSKGYSRYAQQLQSLQPPTALEINDHELDIDEVRAGRKRKRQRAQKQAIPIPTSNQVSVGTPSHTAVNSDSSTSAVLPQPPSPRSRPTAPLALLQGADPVGRGCSAREEFVLSTLNNALAGARSKSLDSRLPTHIVPGPTTLGPLSNEQEAPDQEMVDQASESQSGSESDDEDEGDHNKVDNKAAQAMLKELNRMGEKHRSWKPFLDILIQPLRNGKVHAAALKPKVAISPQSDSEPWEQGELYTCSTGRKAREKRRIALAGYVRHVVLELMGRKSTKDPLPAGPPPEVAAPTAQRFYIKWDEREKSLFNATAARIVAAQVITDWPTLFNDSSDEVFDAATLHIKYLRSCYLRQNDPARIVKEQDRHSRCNADTRKRTLYEHRLRVISAFPVLRKHGRLIETLGIEGTSSDEEDSTRRGVYIVKRQKELSSQVQHLKRQLDQVYELHFKGPGSKGNQVRKRVDNGALSQRKFRIKGLPLCCIDQGWLITLTDVQKTMFDFVDFEYRFDFPKELLEPIN